MSENNDITEVVTKEEEDHVKDVAAEAAAAAAAATVAEDNGMLSCDTSRRQMAQYVLSNHLNSPTLSETSAMIAEAAAAAVAAAVSMDGTYLG